MTQQDSADGSGPSAGPLPSRAAIPSGDRPTYSSDEGLTLRMQRALIRSEIEALNAEFAFLIDHDRSDEVPELFTEDGSYGREGGGRSTGRDALRAVYAMRAARGVRTARHLFTNLRLEFISEREVHGHTILLLFAEDGPPPHLAEANLVSDYRDVYRLGDDGRWRYASRTVAHQFKHPGNKPIVLPLGKA